MDVTKPYEFIGFGAMDVTKPYKFIGFGAMDGTKPYEFIGFGATVFFHRGLDVVWASSLRFAVIHFGRFGVGGCPKYPRESAL